MNALRQIHENGSQSVLTYQQHAWHITLTFPSEHGRTTFAGLMSSDLAEAKAICRRILERETSHVCDGHCLNWEEFQIYQ